MRVLTAIGTVLVLAAISAFAGDYEDGKKFYDSKDYARAIGSFRKAAAQGVAGAQFYLGVMYSDGKGVAQDYKQALFWYEKAAAQGHATAQAFSGAMYYEGIGVARDYKQAVSWYEKAATQGFARAQFYLGGMYSDGKGVAQDYKQAASWYEKAAAQGHERAQFALGLMYYEGQGVAQDYKQAVFWWEKAAVQGNALAQSLSGAMYYEGKGVAQDYKQAAFWYEKAAAQGNAEKQFYLGVMYSDGKGVAQDYKQAAFWYEKAAAQGNAGAQFMLGAAYYEGQGVPQDYVEAHKWFNLAVANGLEGARKSRESLERQMTREQIAEAQRLAAAWKPRGADSTSTQQRPTSPVPQSNALTLKATGSGIIVTDDGLVITNHHVVDSCRELRISPARRPAKLVVSDASNDLALLQSPDIPTKGVATFREGRGVRLGEDVVVYGYPLQSLLSSGGNVTTGTVSAIKGPGNNSSLFQLTAPVQRGNSGGPVVDHSGAVVGVVLAKLDALKLARATGEIPQNVNFAISGSVVRSFLTANGVNYRGAFQSKPRDSAEVAEMAARFTVLVECWQ